MKKTILFLIILSISFDLFSQSEAEKKELKEKLKEAIQLMDNGQIGPSIEILEACKKADPENYVYPYEIGYAHYLNRDYKKAIKVLTALQKYESVTDQCYTLLGNIQDIDGQPKKAIKTYEKGLEKFPNSGRLHFERGIVLDKLQNTQVALDSWEKGIKVEPTYPSNYHIAATIFSEHTTEKIWGILYGELFMNIERGSKKTEEISQLLYNTYKNAITIENDTSKTIHFTKKTVIPFSGEKAEFKIPFSMIFELNMALASTNIFGKKELNIQSIHTLRKAFVEVWYNKKRNEEYPNILFDWHKKLIDLNYFEAYNYWLFMKGNQEEFNTWYDQNKLNFDLFIDWFGDNPLTIDKEHYFHRSQYM